MTQAPFTGISMLPKASAIRLGIAIVNLFHRFHWANDLYATQITAHTRLRREAKTELVILTTDFSSIVTPAVKRAFVEPRKIECANCGGIGHEEIFVKKASIKKDRCTGE
jgi:hypothetical protein